MSVNLPEPGEVHAVAGVQLGTAAAGIKATDREDVAVLALRDGASLAGVFTRSSFRAPPVDIAEERIIGGGVRALLINSGNANAATGEPGRQDAQALCEAAARSLKLDPAQIAPFSTGVIGERLPVASMIPAIEAAAGRLDERNWEPAARAIMTTDTAPKIVSRSIDVAGHRVVVTGMAKGAGMIKPDMATMLAFVCCDANVAPDCLQQLTREVADLSFNRISIDADTSTNDSFVVVATGAAGNPQVESAESAGFADLRSWLADACRTLAQYIVRDAEGASKFVTVQVSGGADASECLAVAYTVAESPLVKTALFAGDPNWGRLCMAIGRAGVANLDTRGVDVSLGEVPVVVAGVMHPDYREEDGAGVMAQDEFTIHISLGRGNATETVWTSDLSYDYVRINAEYRT